MPAIAPWKTSTLLATTAGTVVVPTTSATVATDHTYDPEGFSAPGVSRWVDRVGGIAAGFPSITSSLRKPTKNSRIYKATQVLTIPRMATTSPSTNTGIEPAPTVAYSGQCKLEWLLPERMTVAERVTLYSNVMSMFFITINANDAVPSDATGTPLFAHIVNLDAPY